MRVSKRRAAAGLLASLAAGAMLGATRPEQGAGSSVDRLPPRLVVVITADTRVPACLDMEASGFGRHSYPIEVGFVLGDGQSWCTLIRPAADWTHWDPAAERLTASPGTSQFSAISVLVQSLADVSIVRRLAPSVFWPRPKVESAIVRIDPDPAKRSRIGNVQSFRDFLRELYVHRRKNLRGALSGWPSGRREKNEVDHLLARLKLPGTMRAEELSIEQHQVLWRAFQPRINEQSSFRN